MKNDKKSIRIKSPEYRTFIGKNLKEQRIKEGYTLSDISEMTEIPINTLLGLEKGVVTNIDYYVEYAKAVKYQLSTLKEAKIDLLPAKELPVDKLMRIQLTKLVRLNIIGSGFLATAHSSQEIIEELERLEKIPKNSVSTSELAGVMRNLVSEKIVEVEKKSGNKNSYIVLNL